MSKNGSYSSTVVNITPTNEDMFNTESYTFTENNTEKYKTTSYINKAQTDGLLDCEEKFYYETHFLNIVFLN